MDRLIERRQRPLFWTLGLAYLSLTVWMHIWALEAGLPLPGEPKTPHHQVCTWIGTSGEAAFVDGSPLTLPAPIISFGPSVRLQRPVLSLVSGPVQARAPPVAA